MNYYVNRTTGEDSYDGQAEFWNGKQGPWRTLARASRVILEPGDQLLLHRGEDWKETLSPKGCGTAEDPVVIGAYGVGARPYLHKGVSSEEDCCILLNRVQGYRMVGLEIGEARYGIEIQMDHELRVEWGPYRIEDCYFHDIISLDFPHDQSRGVDLSGWPWAIYKKLNEASDGCILVNLSVEHCFATRTQGFHSSQYSEGGSGFGSIREIGTTYESSTFHYGHYNNFYFCNGTRSTLRNSGMFFGYPNQNEWPYGNAFLISGSPNPSKPTVGNTVVDNEFGWVGDIPGGVDGCVYDLEFSQTDTMVCGNFMHHAFGEAVLTMGYADVRNLTFDGNIIKDVLLYCTNRDMAIDLYNPEGTGIYSDNAIFLQSGQRAFNQKPPGYVFSGNHEGATGEFVAMPKVCAIEVRTESRTYAFTCSTPGAVMRYTVDGSLPDSGSTPYSHPVTVTGTCVLNVKAFKNGFYASETDSILIDFREEESRAAILPGVDVEGAKAPLPVVEDEFTIAFFTKSTGTSEPIGIQLAAEDVIDVPGRASIIVALSASRVQVFEVQGAMKREMLSEDLPTSTQLHIGIVYRQRQPYIFVDGVFRRTGLRSALPVRPLLMPPAYTLFDYPITHAQMQVLSSQSVT